MVMDGELELDKGDTMSNENYATLCTFKFSIFQHFVSLCLKMDSCYNLVFKIL
jgi:hypothetical protein